MTVHAGNRAQRVPAKPKEKGAAQGHQDHERRHKTREGGGNVIGSGATIVGATIQTTSGGGNPANYYPGIVYDATGLKAYDAGGALKAEIFAVDTTVSSVFYPAGSFAVFGAGTITGSIIQTAPTNPRIVLDGQSGTPGLRVYDGAGTPVMNVDINSNTITFGATTTLTGSVIQTASSGSRVVMDGVGLRAYSGVTNTVNIDNTGSFLLQTATSGSRTVIDGTGIRAFSGAVNTVNITNAGSFTLQTATSGARIVLDGTGIHAFNASAVNTVTIDNAGVFTIQTAASGARTVLDGTGIHAFNAGGINTVTIDNAGVFTLQTATSGSRTVIDGTGIRAYSGAVNTVNIDNTGSFTLTTAAAGSSRIVLDGAGIRSYSGAVNTVNIDNTGAFTLTTNNASIAVTPTAVTISSAAAPTSGARIVIDATGIKGWNATDVLASPHFALDATTGLIICQGVITATPGSAVPWQTTGFYIGGGNLLSNASAEDPTQTRQLLYMSNGAGVTAGTFTLKYGTGTVTAALNWNATAAQVATALNAVGVLPTGVTVTTSSGPLPATAVVIDIAGAGEVPTQIVINTQSLTGGSVVCGPVPITAYTGLFPPTPIYGWGTGGTALDFIADSQSYHGGHVFRLTSTSGAIAQMSQSTALMGLNPGVTVFTLSAYVKATTATRQVQSYISYRDINGGLVQDTFATMAGNTSPNWQRVVETQVVPVAATRQQVAITGGTPASGTFKLTYNGQTTAAINFNATAVQVADALQLLSNVGVLGCPDTSYASGGPLPGSPVYVSFLTAAAGGTASSPPTTMTVSASTLSAGTAGVTNMPALQVTAIIRILSPTVGEQFRVDAVQLEIGDAPTSFAPRPDEIVANSVQANMVNVVNLSAFSADLGTITAGTLNAVTVNSSTISGNTITGGSISGVTVSGNTITGGTISGTTITGTTISGNTITGGSIGSTTITGTTITGGTIQTASGTGPKVVMSGAANQFQVIDSSGVVQVSMDGLNGLRFVQGAATINSIEWLLGSTVVGALNAGGGSGIGSALSIYANDFNSPSIYSDIAVWTDPTVNANNFVRAECRGPSHSAIRYILRSDDTSDFAWATHYARMYHSPAWGPTVSGTWYQIVWDQADGGETSLFLGSGGYQVPVAGHYRVSASWSVNCGTAGSLNVACGRGSQERMATNQFQAALWFQDCLLSATISCTLGDVIYIYVMTNGSFSKASTYGQWTNNWVEVMRVG